MLDYLLQMPDVYLFLLLSGTSIFVTIIVVFLIRRYIPLELRYKDNPVIGNMSALISIIYGVLVGLTALYLINNISYTGDAVQREANSVANIYRNSTLLKEPAKTRIQASIKKYLTEVINVEWPQMESGQKINKDGDKIIDSIGKELSYYSGINSTELLILHDMFESVRNLYDGRQQRIQMSYSELNPEIWEVILIGTILTIGINYLFGMNFYLHIVTVSAGALMAAAMLFLLLSLDRPFQGDFVIGPDSFKSLLDTVNQDIADTPTQMTK
ncbi:MAG: DUF4239 domain-containing protein [Gammaproteobacteria bacterium]|nr:DUF4239 domain-containing protein [Gammaproteobacteria bacterium]